jgi:putative oxidoreductase
MRKLLSTKYSSGAFNAAMLLLRLGTGILMAAHGYDKLKHFSEKVPDFINFMGIGQSASLALCIFAELFCSLFLIIGLFTRFATIPLIITMLVALIKVHKGDIFGNGETVVIYLVSYMVLLFVGPGKVSVDSMISK